MKSFYDSLKIFRTVFILFILFIIKVSAQDPTQSLINGGNITSWVSNDGFHDWVVNGDFNGSYPNGLPVGVIFSEGI